MGYGNVSNEFETKEKKIKPEIKLNHNIYMCNATLAA